MQVSIPIGFSSSLQRQVFGYDRSRYVQFQSLSGFQVRCNLTQKVPSNIKDLVSIPIGFSSSLQPLAEGEEPVIYKEFQSLSGFQVRCNHRTHASQHGLTEQFQSLSGFQVRCNIQVVVFVFFHTGVSIPIGFSSSLQQHELAGRTWRLLGFNPYRVFKFAATFS